jgi:hypothetical protein
MKDTYKAVEVYEPGKLRVVERPVAEPGAGRFAFGWKHVESVTPMRPQ